MKKSIYLIALALILGLVLTGCSLLSSISQVPATGQSGITYLTKNGILNPALVGLWRFNGDANDSSGYDNHGTVHGAGYSSGSPIMGEALSFDGVDDYVNVDDTTGTLDVDRITIEAWIYFDETLTAGHKNLVRKGYYGDRCYGLSIGLRATGEIAGWVNLGSAGGSGALIARGSVLSSGSWHHVAMTYDGVKVRVYVDGTEAGTSTTLSGDIFDNNLSVRIGGQPATDSGGPLAFKGLIDEVRIWNTALTEDQLGDITPPEVNISFPTPDGSAGWFITSPVVGNVTATDPSYVTAIDVTGATLSDVIGLGTTTASGTLTVSAEGINDIIATATDGVGNTGAAPGSSNNETIKIDTQKPVVTFALPGTGEYVLGETVSAATWSAEDPIPGSGLATPSSGTFLIDTSTVGTKTFTVTATDNAGNIGTETTVTYTVIYEFSGFFRPVENSPTWNIAKAGRAIPVKFSLSGDQGLEIFAGGYPMSVEINDNSTVPAVATIETVTAEGSSLNYDDTDDQYIYVWKTDKSWAGTCQRLEVQLKDGTSHFADFKFK
jgi:hypothetical protein